MHPTASNCWRWATEAHTASVIPTHFSGIISLTCLRPFSLMEHNKTYPSVSTATSKCKELDSSNCPKPLSPIAWLLEDENEGWSARGAGTATVGLPFVSGMYTDPLADAGPWSSSAVESNCKARLSSALHMRLISIGMHHHKLNHMHLITTSTFGLQLLPENNITTSKSGILARRGMYISVYWRLLTQIRLYLSGPRNELQSAVWESHYYASVIGCETAPALHNHFNQIYDKFTTIKQDHMYGIKW